MPSLLKKFTEFSFALYPHEIHYLLQVSRLQGKDSLRILQLIHYNSRYPENRLPFDATIDKRKYSNVKKWIQEKLERLDVDRFYAWINEVEGKIMTDAIGVEDEKRLLRLLSKISPVDYYFLQFYELVQQFRDFLLIRMRIAQYKQVSDFLNRYNRAYKRALAINNKLNSASFDIIQQHAYSAKESEQWVQLLTRTFRDAELDGYTRYRAVVRLLYIYYNYRAFDSMKAITEEMDRLLRSPDFYSKRILANYYANRAMMHQKRNELTLASQYGYLSVRQKNSDYIFYVNNLCGILLKQNKSREALQLMQEAIKELQNSNSFYNRIGFVSLYLRTLLANGKQAQAESYGETFHRNYKKEILEHRWHMFYKAYLQTMLQQHKYKKIITTIRRNHLLDRERESLGKAGYLPSIQWYYRVAAYLDAETGERQTLDYLKASLQEMRQNSHKQKKIDELILEIEPHIPVVISKLEK